MRVRLFAALREIAGSAWIDAPDEPDVSALIEEVATRYGERFGAIVAAGTVVVNGRTADLRHPLDPGDEVALLPPVSGGRSSPR